MGAQTNQGNEQLSGEPTELRLDNYLFQIVELSEGKINIEVVNNKTFQVFRVENYAFQGQANVQTLIAAIKKKQEKFLKAAVEQVSNEEDKPQLKVTLKVTYDFIPHFEENIILSLREGVSDSELLQTQLRLINNDIKEMEGELSTTNTANYKKHVFVLKSGSYNQAAHTIIGFKLPRGKYNISLGFYTLSSQNWIYLKLNYNSIDVLKLAEGGYYFTLNNSSAYQPHILTGFVEVNEDIGSFALETPNSNSYPWQLQNLVLSATLQP